MKKQFFASSGELKDLRDKAKKERENDLASCGVTQAIENISQAINDLKDIGVNVELQMIGWPSEDAFALVKASAEVKGSLIVPVYGILKVDQFEHLLAISMAENNNDVLKLYISDFDYRSNSLDNKNRGTCFDLMNDPKAIFNFQQRIIFSAAINSRRFNDCVRYAGFKKRTHYDKVKGIYKQRND